MTKDRENHNAPTMRCPGCGQDITLLRHTPFYAADALETHRFSCPAKRQLARDPELSMHAAPGRSARPAR